MSPDVVIFAIGNPSRGDDALGPLLMERLRDWLPLQPEGARFELVEDFQLQVEHALDLEGKSLALFIDAGSGTPAPYSFTPVRAAGDLAHTSHALEPATVLHVQGKLQGTAPPPAFVLCVRGEAFELGEPLSPAALEHLEQAWERLQSLCRDACPEAWAYNSGI